jgi:hypothetical protein
MKKLLIALFFVFGLFLVLPMSARAENYNLWVGGVRVTSENMHDIKGSGILKSPQLSRKPVLLLTTVRSARGLRILFT